MIRKYLKYIDRRHPIIAEAVLKLRQGSNSQTCSLIKATKYMGHQSINQSVILLLMECILRGSNGNRETGGRSVGEEGRNGRGLSTVIIQSFIFRDKSPLTDSSSHCLFDTSLCCWSSLTSHYHFRDLFVLRKCGGER